MTNQEIPGSDSSLSDLNISIAIRKGTSARNSLYPMSKYVSYKKLSPWFHAFVSKLSHVEIPKDIEVAPYGFLNGKRLFRKR